MIVHYNLKSYFDNFDNGLSTTINNGGLNLSGGQKQLIAFLRAVISKKSVIILDEPTSNMDNGLRETIANIILTHELANILLIISHDTVFEAIEAEICLA